VGAVVDVVWAGSVSLGAGAVWVGARVVCVSTEPVVDELGSEAEETTA
jgi:hypothetical protein